MCLRVNDIVKEMRVAEKPITVYKILKKTNNTFKTPYRDTVCKMGKTLKAKYNILRRPYQRDIEGEAVHAYKTLLAARYSSIPLQSPKEAYYITEWQIPKGAKYWTGIQNNCLEIAATKMKFVKVVEEAKRQQGFLLRPTISFCILNEIATHYITDEGEIKPIKEDQKVDMWHLAWVTDDLKKLVPETIMQDGEEFKFYIKKGEKDPSCWHEVGYRNHNSDNKVFYFDISTLSEGHIYAHMLTRLLLCGYLGEKDLKKKINFEIENLTYVLKS